MKEEDLLNLGFIRYDQDDEDDKFYYYYYDLNGKSGCGSLISDSDDEVRDRNETNWKVYAWDINENLVFDNVDDVKTYIDVIEKNIKLES